MSLAFRVLLLLVLWLVVVEALPSRFRGRFVYPNTHTHESAATAALEQDGDVNAHFFEQKLDHFDRQNPSTFPQRYFINDTYWNGPQSGAPVFLCVGGEGPPLTWMVLVASDHCNDMVELAPQLGALLVALEHRYYGPSNPFGDWATENLKWLSTEQALEDIAHFHEFISTKYDLTSENRWVSFGGSYPGMLSAFARLKYPHLFHASVSSSSPTRAKVDMTEYNDVVSHSMAATIVGGSEECLAAIKEGHAEVGALLSTAKGRAELVELFNICNPTSLDDENNQEVFAGDGVIYLPVQSNDPSCTTDLCNIQKICEVMVNTSIGTPIERMASISATQSGGSCVAVSYDAVLAFYAAPKNAERAWLYQTCTEWGFYQTCQTYSECPYTQGLHTIDYDFTMCATAFNVSKDTIVRNVRLSNVIYGGDMIQGSRILFPNGQIDPWSSLGVLSSPNGDEPTLWVEGASHHFWTHESLPTDSVQVQAAREAIWMQVIAWLKESP